MCDVHLELVASLNLTDFLSSFRRFVARRGIPKKIYSDNGRTFVGAGPRLQRLYTINAPEWLTICPLAPWRGGWWERIVRTVKSGLRKTLGKARLTRHEFETQLLEIEFCINSRPITRFTELPNFTGALTPNHFLFSTSDDGETTVEDLKQPLKTLRDLSLDRQRAAKTFWEIWSKLYLTNLPGVVINKKRTMPIHVGDMVLVKEDMVKRIEWPLGIITSTNPGQDGLTRTVTVKTQQGSYQRPIQRIVRLELEPNLKEL